MAAKKPKGRRRTVRASDGKRWTFVEDATVKRLKKADPIGWSFCWDDHIRRMNEGASLTPWKDKPLRSYTSFYRWHGLLLDVTTNLTTRTTAFKIKG